MPDFPPIPPPSSSLRAVRWVAGGMVSLLLVAALAFVGIMQASPPPPSEIADDPVLARGFGIYATRCVSCHGPTGRGDGPLARSLAGPAPRNLVEDRWKHGDSADEVLTVLTNGIKDSAMPAWGGIYGRRDLKAVAAYVYHIAERAIPRQLRVP